MFFPPLKATGCKVSSSLRSSWWHYRHTQKARAHQNELRSPLFACNLKDSMWSLLAPVPNANPLEQHVQVVGGKGRRGQILCAPYDHICGIKPTITSEVVSAKQTSYLLPNFKCQRDARRTPSPQLFFLTYLVTCQVLIPAFKWSWVFPFVSPKSFPFQSRL